MQIFGKILPEFGAVFGKYVLKPIVPSRDFTNVAPAESALADIFAATLAVVSHRTDLRKMLAVNFDILTVGKFVGY